MVWACGPAARPAAASVLTPLTCAAFGVFAILPACVAVLAALVCVGFSARSACAAVFAVCAFAVPALPSIRAAAFAPALCAAPPRAALAEVVFAAAPPSGALAASNAPADPGWGAYSVSTGRTARSVGASAAAGVRFAVRMSRPEAVRMVWACGPAARPAAASVLMPLTCAAFGVFVALSACRAVLAALVCVGFSAADSPACGVDFVPSACVFAAPVLPSIRAVVFVPSARATPSRFALAAAVSAV